MGIFGSKPKTPYQDVPDEKLDFNQRQWKKWRSNDRFYVDSGGYYEKEHKLGIDNRLQGSLGLTNIDDLFQMKAPRFYQSFNDTADNVQDLCGYIYKVLPQMEKQCAEQTAMLEKLIEQNEKLIAQNEKLQNQLLEKNISPSSFTR